MKCPYCSDEETRVVETRSAGSAVRRRRECPSCEKRFTTYERIDAPTLRIIKKDESRESFDRQKLMGGMLLSCEKRPVSQGQIEKAVSKIESELQAAGKKEIKSEILGELVMRELRELDEVAYIRFASVYRDFTDAKSFTEEIKKLSKSSK